MYVVVGKYWQKNPINIFGFWCQRHNTVRPYIKIANDGREPIIHGFFSSIGSYLLSHDRYIYSLLFCHIIYSLYAVHITISILELDFFHQNISMNVINDGRI